MENDTKTSSSNVTEVCEDKNALNNSSSSNESENLGNIKKFIEDQEIMIKQNTSVINEQILKEDAIIETKDDTTKEKKDDAIEEVNDHTITEKGDKTTEIKDDSGKPNIADMILSDTEQKVETKENAKEICKPELSTADKGGNSVALSVGSKVEARDFTNVWHPATITEVDFDEMEVLVHYDHDPKGIIRHDEWISVSSPRLRPFGIITRNSAAPSEDNVSKELCKDGKVEDKPKLTFSVGERCLARWRDNKRFMATINKELGNGAYEIVFDDGFLWKCTTSRLYKCKPGLTVDTNVQSPSTVSASSPIQTGGPSNSNVLVGQTAFHTHLFDPNRDYLSTKSERREMKRKLNIKEIFNIGQKRQKTQRSDKPKVPVERKPRIIKKKRRGGFRMKKEVEIKTELPDAVASIIGTIGKEDPQTPDIKYEEMVEPKAEADTEDEMKVDDSTDDCLSNAVDSKADTLSEDGYTIDIDPVYKEEVKLEQFDKIDGSKHEEVIDKIKEVISKLEDGLNKIEKPATPKPECVAEVKEVTEVKLELEEEIPYVQEELNLETQPEVKVEDKPIESVTDFGNEDKQKKFSSKIKKGKKLRLLQEKKVKKEVEKVKSELEEMKKQVEEMRKQMLMKTQQLSNGHSEMPDSFLLPGEWCCKWVNGQPVGTVSEMLCEPKVDTEGKPGLPRRSVQVEDKRLPPGWTKHMVRRSLGHSAGKWDVVLVNPNNRRFHTKTDMRNFLEQNTDPSLKPFEYALMDFGVHLKLSRRMGWISHTPDGEAEAPSIISPSLAYTSPLVKRKKLNLKKMSDPEKRKRLTLKLKLSRMTKPATDASGAHTTVGEANKSIVNEEPASEVPPLEDGFVYVGSLKVEVIDNLLRCPAEGCFKNFRNNTLLKMHIKHYHREMRKLLGATPKVLDLAYARTKPNKMAVKKKSGKPKLRKLKLDGVKAEKLQQGLDEVVPDLLDIPKTPDIPESVAKLQDSPKLRDALSNKPVKRPRVLLPVRRPDEQVAVEESKYEMFTDFVPAMQPLDFEAAISTHTVTKPIDKPKKTMKVKHPSVSQKQSDDEEWYMNNSDVDTRSSLPGSATPDSKTMEGVQQQPVSAETAEPSKDDNLYTYTESGERVKIVHMKREEIINCHCGFREEDGLMVQCELCLCWQHALCHNIRSEAEVPEKYTCSICLNPRRGRRSRRYVHDQDRLYEGLLPGARAQPALRRAHELAGNLLRLQDALHALAHNYHIATKKNHPKLYLWAKDWDQSESSYIEEKINSDYSDLNIMINTLGKENLPIKVDEVKMKVDDLPLDIKTPPSEEPECDRFSQRSSQIGTQSLLSSFLSSPGGASLDLPISTSELERLAKCVQEEGRVQAPQPEAAIENSACRAHLLRHLQRAHAQLDARLDSIEAQVAELESQDPSFEDDDTADYFPRTKQTVQMLLRDLDTMEELALVT